VRRDARPSTLVESETGARDVDHEGPSTRIRDPHRCPTGAGQREVRRGRREGERRSRGAHARRRGRERKGSHHCGRSARHRPITVNVTVVV
jgi:hypothetical protein